MTQRLTTEEVAHLARLARLSINQDRIEQYRNELARVLDHVAELESLGRSDKTAGKAAAISSAASIAEIEPLSHPGNLRNMPRADSIGEHLQRDTFLTGAPKVEATFVAVPRALNLDSGKCDSTPRPTTRPTSRMPTSVAFTPLPHQHAVAISRQVRSGERTAVDIIEETIARIESANPIICCFREVLSDAARIRAQEIDRIVASDGDPGPLAGVPLAVKDNIVTEAGASAAGSRILENYCSPFTATAAGRLEEAGAIIVGKTHCDEFGMGSSNEHCAFGVTVNPHDSTRVAGGSSGGSAAAVAAGLVPAALGSDTGGSIRLPASFCGVFGLKPTYGRVSRYGLIAYGSSLEQIGPFATSIEDTAVLLRVMAGHDDRDATSANRPVDDYPADLDKPIDGLRIGVPKQYRSDELDSAVTSAMNAALDGLRQRGAKVVDLDLPLLDAAIAMYYIIAPAEASSNLARYDGVRYGLRADITPDEGLQALYSRTRSEYFGEEVQRRIMLGTYVLSAGYIDQYYTKALKARRLLCEEFAKAWKQCHVILGPTAPGPAFRIGEKSDPLTMYLTDVFTVAANLAGHCAISIPAGTTCIDHRDLPIGLQLQAPAFDEHVLLRAAGMCVK